MTWTISELILQASLMVKLVMLLLLVFSVGSWACIFQRIFYFYRIQKDLVSYDLSLQNKSFSIEGLSSGPFNNIIQRLRDVSKQDIPIDKQALMVSLLDLEESQLVKPLSFLAMVSQVSPYIGLFGTVWGIMLSLQSLGDAQATIQTVAPGMAEALIATALGLLVAIPAAMAYNRLSMWSSALMSQMSACVSYWVCLDSTNTADR